MKKIIAFLFMFTLIVLSYCQKAMTFKESKEKGISTAYLDSIYASGLVIFKNNQDEYVSSYQNLLQDLGQYLKENNFSWTKPTASFNRIFFDKEGKIDYFIYNFRPEQLTIDEEKRFYELLTEFIKKYHFPLTATKKFSQCSPVTYMPDEN